MHFDVSDDVLPANNRRFTMEVSGGAARVRKGGRGDLKIDVRGLAPLYSGHLSVRELQSTGYVNGSEDALAAAGAIFAGPAPWMPDIF